MKGISGKRVRITGVLLAVLLIIITAACQPTPDEPVVVNKNKDLVEEVRKEEPSPSSSQNIDYSKKLRNLVIPERYTFQSEDEKSSLVINVDADVRKPDSGKMPFARVKPMNFTQDMVTGMFNYLFTDEKPYLPREQLTKSEIEEQILHFQGMLSKGEIGGEPISDEDKEHFNQMISDYQKQWETAPDKTPELVTSDGTMQYKETAGKISMPDEEGKIEEKEITSKYYELHVNLDGTFLAVNVSADELNPGSSLWYVNTERNFSTDGMQKVNPGDELPEAVQKKLKLPVEEAIAKADGFFAAGGVEDVRFFASYLVDDHGTGHVDGNYDPASHFAYMQFYTRTVNGVPVSCHESHSASGGGFDRPWFYESIMFLISDDGILEINWESPCEASEIIEDDVDLINFDTAIKAFENTVKYTFGQYLQRDENVSVEISIQIDNIQLNLVRLKEKDTADEKAGLYVPAYVFYGAVKERMEYKNEDYVYEGYKTSSGSGNDFYPGPFVVIAVNAIDGSIIDMMNAV